MGTIAYVNDKDNTIKIRIDKSEEEKKAHNVHMGMDCLTSQYVKKNTHRRFYRDFDIEKEVGLKSGICNKITGSFLVSYFNPETEDRDISDLGLNIKNFRNQTHIPNYVRYSDKPAAET
jgi:CRISPR/Cas system CSM-associated protein Csm2 small subunit